MVFLRTKCFFNFKKLASRHFSSENRWKPPWNVLFFGTDDFSVYTLKTLFKEYKNGHLLNKLEVITSIQSKTNPVQKFAEKQKLTLHNWPSDVAINSFHVGVVVSFGHLIPENVINKFPFGMLNVHASLLPRWRGAAPMIYAIANDDKVTGISIMKIAPKKFDVGEIVLQAKFDITNTIKMPELYEKLGELGAEKLLSTLHDLPTYLENAKPQPEEGVTLAPKVTQKFAEINWNTMTARQVYNLERALVGFLQPLTTYQGVPIKLYEVEECDCDKTYSDKPGFISYNKTNKLITVACANRTFVSVKKVGMIGKKVMSAADFNNGFLTKVYVEDRYFK